MNNPHLTLDDIMCMVPCPFPPRPCWVMLPQTQGEAPLSEWLRDECIPETSRIYLGLFTLPQKTVIRLLTDWAEMALACAPHAQGTLGLHLVRRWLADAMTDDQLQRACAPLLAMEHLDPAPSAVALIVMAIDTDPHLLVYRNCVAAAAGAAEAACQETRPDVLQVQLAALQEAACD